MEITAVDDWRRVSLRLKQWLDWNFHMLMWNVNYLHEGGNMNNKHTNLSEVVYLLSKGSMGCTSANDPSNVYDTFEKASINIIALLAAFQSMLVYL